MGMVPLKLLQVMLCEALVFMLVIAEMRRRHDAEIRSFIELLEACDDAENEREDANGNG